MKFKRALWYLVGSLLLAARPVLAAGVGIGAIGGALPWERPLTLIATSVSGPVAAAVGIVAFCITGCMLAFGHDWGEFARRALQVGMAVSFVSGAAGFLLALFGVAGAMV